jgi:hypothetical protein
MTAIELADVPLVELASVAVGVRSARRWTVYVPGCRPGHGETYLEAFADALRSRVAN